MAAYGAWRKAGKTDKQAQANLLKLFKNVVVQDTSARASPTPSTAARATSCSRTRTRRFSRMQGLDLQWVIPKSTILIENPIAVTKTSENKDKANAFLRFLRTPAAQQVFADYGYRPVVKSVREKNRKKFPVRPGDCSRSTSSARRLGEGAEAVLRPEEQHHGPDRAAGRR